MCKAFQIINNPNPKAQCKKDSVKRHFRKHILPTGKMLRLVIIWENQILNEMSLITSSQ